MLSEQPAGVSTEKRRSARLEEGALRAWAAGVMESVRGARGVPRPLLAGHLRVWGGAWLQEAGGLRGTRSPWHEDKWTSRKVTAC